MSSSCVPRLNQLSLCSSPPRQGQSQHSLGVHQDESTAGHPWNWNNGTVRARALRVGARVPPHGTVRRAIGDTSVDVISRRGFCCRGREKVGVQWRTGTSRSPSASSRYTFFGAPGWSSRATLIVHSRSDSDLRGINRPPVEKWISCLEVAVAKNGTSIGETNRIHLVKSTVAGEPRICFTINVFLPMTVTRLRDIWRGSFSILEISQH